MNYGVFNTYNVDSKYENSLEWIKTIAEQFQKLSNGCKFEKKNNISAAIYLPNHGSIEYLMLENGLGLLKADCFIQNKIIINHIPTVDYEYSFFHFSITLDTTFIDTPGIGEINFGENFSRAIFYSTSNLGFKIIYPAYKKVKYINVFASKQWLKENLQMTDLPGYSLEAKAFNDAPFQKMYSLNLQCYNLVKELIRLPSDKNYELLYLTGKLLLLLSVFCKSTDKMIGREEQRFIEDSRLISREMDMLLLGTAVWPDLDTVAERSGLSRTKFASVFKKKYGKSYYAFYTDFRLKKAYDAIINDNLTISEAAWNIGFTNLGHFSKLFKQYFGVLPSLLKR